MAITTNGGAGTVLAVSNDLALAISDESGTGVVVFNTSPTLVTPTLGTASATAIELGHATDTTLARVSAGVVSIEGVNVVTTTSTDTLTNKTLTSPALTTPTISTATTNGDLLYGTGSGALARLGIGATSTLLTVVAGVPAWVAATAGTTGNDQAFAFGVQVYS